VQGRKFQGTKVPGSESSRERKFHVTFAPGSESSRERKFQEAKVPPMVLSLLGAKVRGNESSIIRLTNIRLCVRLLATLTCSFSLFTSLTL